MLCIFQSCLRHESPALTRQQRKAKPALCVCACACILQMFASGFDFTCSRCSGRRGSLNAALHALPLAMGSLSLFGLRLGFVPAPVSSQRRVMVMASLDATHVRVCLFFPKEGKGCWVVGCKTASDVMFCRLTAASHTASGSASPPPPHPPPPPCSLPLLSLLDCLSSRTGTDGD